MRVRADLVCLAIIAASWSLPSVSTASPIADLEWLEDGDFFAFDTKYRLTDSDLSVLAAREDKGWHLGWFLQDRVWMAGERNVLGLPDISDALIAASMPELVGLAPAGSLSEALTDPTLGTASAAAVVPEPATLLLIGTGVCALAVRRKRETRFVTNAYCVGEQASPPATYGRST